MGDFFGDIGKNLNSGWQYLTNNGYLGWQDALLPGYSALNQMFDFTGQKAAQAQFENQMFLDNSARQFSADEAAKQRAWEEYMSNTSVQRAVKDIKDAGLNPWLALQGSGALNASTPSGSSAVSQSGNASMANNKLAVAAGIIATALRMFLAKH